ncbi:MAG: hypothetical protein ACYSX0_11075 [Planctomycetota bacterium]|jgi:hypothetical protein
MWVDNTEEYKLVRDELQNLRNCVTTFVGFVLAGSAAAFLLVGRSARDAGGELGLVSLGLGLLLFCVVSLLLYKFNSHNRYAGYCKLLAQERLVTADEGERRPRPGALLAWEICMDQLRKSDLGTIDLVKQAQAVAPRIVGLKAGSLVERINKLVTDSSGTRPADRANLRRGCAALWQVLTGKGPRSDSWHYPPYVVQIIAILSAIFLVLGLVFCFSKGTPLHMLIATGLGVLQLLIWGAALQKLGALSNGSATVDNLCWRFVPIRFEFVHNHLGSELLEYRLVAVDPSVEAPPPH